MYSQDWIMRHIEMFAQFISRTIFGKTTIEYVVKDENSYTQSDLLYGELKRLVAQRKICEAEDMLFDAIDSSNIDYLELAVDFYSSLNKLSNKELEANNFSREEIAEGFKKIAEKYDVDDLELLEER